MRSAKDERSSKRPNVAQEICVHVTLCECNCEKNPPRKQHSHTLEIFCCLQLRSRCSPFKLRAQVRRLDFEQMGFETNVEWATKDNWLGFQSQRTNPPKVPIGLCPNPWCFQFVRIPAQTERGWWGSGKVPFGSVTARSLKPNKPHPN